MLRLQNTKGGITAAATRNIYTGMVRAIFTYGSEIWHRHTKMQDYDPRYLPMKRLKYQALKRITGAYNGSNQLTLAGIAAIEPLEQKLDYISVLLGGTLKSTLILLESG